MSETRQMRCVCTDESPTCVALMARPIDSVLNEDIAAACKALGDPHRLAIGQLLGATDGRVCVVDIERHLPLSQSTVSYHLKTLVHAGILAMERQGRWSYYTVQHQRLIDLASAIELFSGHSPQVESPIAKSTTTARKMVV